MFATFIFYGILWLFIVTDMIFVSKLIVTKHFANNVISPLGLERLSMWHMLNCAEQVPKQKYKTHTYKTPKTACVQTIMLKHPTKQ